MHRPRPLLAVGAAVLASLLAACGDPEVPGDEAVASSTTPSAPTTTAPATDASPAATSTTTEEGFGTGRVEVAGRERGLLSDVEATADGRVDRVTFTFEGAVPGYRVEYVERPVVQDGSGDEIEVDGERVLLVHFDPASGFDTSGEGRSVYRGPERLDLATRVVLDVTRVSDFEANLEWAIGVDAGARFRVRTATAPGRVIVEVEVPPAG